MKHTMNNSDTIIIVSKDPLSITMELEQLGGYTVVGLSAPEYSYLWGDITRTKDLEEKRKATLSTKTIL